MQIIRIYLLECDSFASILDITQYMEEVVLPPPAMTMIHTQLQQQGLKQTPARLAILDLMGRKRRPFDAAEILHELHSQLLDVNQATVYRILDVFVHKGLVRRLEFQEGKYRYELATSEHHHLVCENCGKIEDISDCNIPEFEKEIAIKKHFLVKHHSLEFFGLCQNCQR